MDKIGLKQGILGVKGVFHEFVHLSTYNSQGMLIGVVINSFINSMWITLSIGCLKVMFEKFSLLY